MDYTLDELKLDLSELHSIIKVLQISVQQEQSILIGNDIDNVLEIVLNKLNIIKRNINYTTLNI